MKPLQFARVPYAVFEEKNMFVSIYTFMSVKAARDLKHFRLY